MREQNKMLGLAGLLLAVGALAYIKHAVDNGPGEGPPLPGGQPKPYIPPEAPQAAPATEPAPTQQAKPQGGLFMTPMQSFVAKAWDAAVSVASNIGWPRDLLLAQAAHESNMGRSELAVQWNNLFGIKADAGWSGDTTPPMPTWEVIGGKSMKVLAKFRAYPSWEASMHDWHDFLQRPRYANAVAAANAGDAQGFFKGLKEGGYATDPLYDGKLAGVYAQVQRTVV